jgi:hypothetical protein
MASVLYNLLMGNDTTTDTVALLHENDKLTQDSRDLEWRVAEVEEDMLRISDAFDRRGTLELTGMSETDSFEIPLATVKKVAATSRAMMTMNPFVKRGVEARIGYIWGKNVQFDGVDGIQQYLDDNRRRLFSPQALAERERVLATDGNMFTAHPRQAYVLSNQATSFRIILDQITGSVSNPDDQEDIWYYKREWSTRETNGKTGEIVQVDNKRWYPSMQYAVRNERDGKSMPRRWGGVGVDQNYVIQHEAVNRQVGWRWGVPDIMPVIFWAKAYKEYLEDNATLVKAYSRLAWQAKLPANGNGPGLAAQMMTPPSRDPLTGESRSVGATQIGGQNLEMTPVVNNASTVDFSKGAPLASAIAAGLEVSQTVITSNSGDAGSNAAEQTLDLPTLKAMESRQQIHTESFMELFKYWGAAEPVVVWPQIFSDATKDTITALGTAYELGVLFPQEARAGMLDAFNIAPYKPIDEMPDPADDVQNQYKEQQAKLAFDQQKQMSNESAIAKQGVSGGTSAKGGSQTANNASRDNRNADKNNK